MGEGWLCLYWNEGKWVREECSCLGISLTWDGRVGREEKGKGGIGAKDAGKELFNISFLSLSAEMCKLKILNILQERLRWMQNKNWWNKDTQKKLILHEEKKLTYNLGINLWQSLWCYKSKKRNYVWGKK